MKVKKSEIQLLIAVIGILIAVATYFLVYTKYNEKSDALESQNASLASQVATLQVLDERKADYIAATEKMRNYITAFENRYPADILPEDSIMMINTLEGMTRTTVASIAFGEGSEVAYAAAQTTDTAATDTTSADGSEASGTAAVSSPITTEATTYADTHMYEVPLSISIECTYNDFKGLIRYIYSLQERKSVHGISIGYNAETGMLSGSMNLSSYYLQGTDKIYTEPDISGVGLGVDTIFGNME